jgi:CubicO group peptidase (beta-lactamase class C family)
MHKKKSMVRGVVMDLLAVVSLCFFTFAGQTLQPTPQGVFNALMEALNSKDETRLRDFLIRQTTGDVPVEQRLSRLKALVETRAPFKMVSPAAQADDSVRALVEDKNGEQFAFIMEIEKGPQPRMRSVRIGPPDMLDASLPKDYTGWKDLDSLGAGIRSDTKSPAIAIAMIRNGKMEQTVSGVRAVDGKDPVLPDDPWSLGSIGKPVCSTILGMLIEAGRLRWDLTLGEALADLPMKPGYRSVTIEQIMHHRGGIPEDPGFTRDRVMRIVAGATAPMKIRENYAPDILGRDLIAKPGARFAYSNAGYALLGVIAERTMEKPYEALVRQYVFEPLGLKHSYTAADQMPERRPSGHVPGPQGLQKQNFSGPLEILMAPAGGGLYMSAGDLARFGEAHLKGLRGQDGLLKTATVLRLHQGIPEEQGGARQYACGWGIEAFPGIETMHTHNGSNGTFRAQISIFPEVGLVVAAFVNCGGESEPSPPLQAALAIAKRYAPAAR